MKNNKIKSNKLFRASPLRLTLALTGAVTLGALEVSAASTEAYNWKNVQIQGGGYIPGVIFNRGEQNLIYTRTDMGGAYRWDNTNSQWIPLFDWVGWDNWGWNGVLSMATDAVDPNRVYAALGMYTNGWDPTMGAIARSTDRGATWKTTVLPFHIGGNMPGRGMGERLAIDPNNNSILYFAAEGGNGLWRSTDYGVTWAQVTNFPNVGNYAADPTDINNYGNQNQGLTWVSFDPSTGSSGVTTKGIYVGVADKANPVYRSLDAGVTWERVAGQPTGYLAHKGVIDSVNGYLYIATSDTGGPYDGGKGDVWRFQISTGTWTNISPIASTSSSAYFGYSGLTIDRKNPKTLMVASLNSWWPDAIFYRSTDSGATWSPIWSWTSYPSRSFKYTIDITEVPWLNFGVTSPVAPDTSPKLAWMNESLEIDPFNSNHFMYGTGATLYNVDNLTNWDSGGQITIKPRVKGLEEVAVLDLAAPPSGAILFSGLGDVGGFRHDDLTKVPSTIFTTPTFGSTASLDFAELAPTSMVRVSSKGEVGVTSNGGSSWWAGAQPSGSTSGGTVAMSANGGTIVWSTGGTAGVLYSTTSGSTWTASSGVPAGAQVRADRVNPKKFYALSSGAVYLSTDGGATFAKTAASNLPAGAKKLKPVFGKEGDIWVAGGSTTTTYGLWHSTDSGATFTKLASVQEADNVTFGKAASGATYPAIYTIAKIDGVRGAFRSNDGGATWVRINDDAHQYGNWGDALAGDQRTYGRVYVGTNGRGILYGDSTGTTTSSSSVASSSVATSSSSVAVSSSSVATSSAVATSSSSKSSSSVATSSAVATSSSVSISSSVATSSSSSKSSSSAAVTSSSVATSSSVGSSSSAATTNQCTYVISSQWNGGFNGAIRIKNNKTTAINGWSVSWTYANGSKVTNAWNAVVTGSNPYSAVNASYNGTIAPGATVEFGFSGSMPSGTSASIPTVTGAACN